MCIEHCSDLEQEHTVSLNSNRNAVLLHLFDFDQAKLLLCYQFLHQSNRFLVCLLQFLNTMLNTGCSRKFWLEGCPTSSSRESGLNQSLYEAQCQSLKELINLKGFSLIRWSCSLSCHNYDCLSCQICLRSWWLSSIKNANRSHLSALKLWFISYGS